MSALPEPELTRLEASLAALRPQVGSLNRDQVLFRAGQASVRRGWGWPATALSCGLAASALALAWWLQPVAEPGLRIVYVEAPPAPTPPPSVPAVAPEEEKSPAKPARLPELAYLRLREQVLRFGLDGLPALPPLPPAAGEDPLSVEGLLKLR